MFKKMLMVWGIISGVIAGIWGLINLKCFIDLHKEGKSYTKFIKEAYEMGCLFGEQYLDS